MKLFDPQIYIDKKYFSSEVWYDIGGLKSFSFHYKEGESLDLSSYETSGFGIYEGDKFLCYYFNGSKIFSRKRRLNTLEIYPVGFGTLKEVKNYIKKDRRGNDLNIIVYELVPCSEEILNKVNFKP